MLPKGNIHQKDKKKIIEREENFIQSVIKNDIISGYDDFLSNFKNQISDIWISKIDSVTWQISFFYIIDAPTPLLSAVVKVDKDLNVEVFQNSPSSGLFKVPSFKVNSFLSSKKITTWTQFVSMLAFFKDSDFTTISIKDQILIAASF